jgi:trehalose 6-phosphate synthase
MRITLRLIVSLVLAISAAVAGFTLFQAYEERGRLVADLDRRASYRAEELVDDVAAALQPGASRDLAALVERIRSGDRLTGVAVYDAQGRTVAATSSLASKLPPMFSVVQNAQASGVPQDDDEVVDGKTVRIHARPVLQGDKRLGTLAIFHETDYIDHHVSAVWKRNALRLFIQAFLIIVVTLLVVRWTILQPMGRLADWIKQLRTGTAADAKVPPPIASFKPLAAELGSLVRSYQAARAAAEEEARLRESGESVWTAERLKEHTRTRLQGRPLVVASNREPYMHVRENKEIRLLVPASGLVTAIEPILRACGGTWIAHGSGNADGEMVGPQGRLRVPPDDPRYVLRRVWLTPEEEEGYYYGFSNEGLWPLCHIAHTRPLFRPGDWEMYRKVNGRFCDGIIEEIEGTTEPFVLIQDYHFAILPQLVKSRRPDARVAIFWHIPWPNPEAFGICPWQGEILEGMLGADVVGFHIQYHCNNFLETVDRTLEARVDWEHFAVNRREHVTYVRPFPISVDFTGAPAASSGGSGLPARDRVARELGFAPRFRGIGVDRVDYTKGILERFRAIERLLEKHPAYQGQFTFVQVGAPSRTHIPRYHDLNREVDAEAARINARFRTAGPWQPIVLRMRHHSHVEIEPFFQAADVCLVTSLHDGMNLVAKEFVVSRDDEQGMLVLSQFAGASRLLVDALIVNPYDVDQTAEAIRAALEMAPADQRKRMQRMRSVIRERNVYRWAAELIDALAGIRLEASSPAWKAVPAADPAGRGEAPVARAVGTEDRGERDDARRSGPPGTAPAV